MKLSTLSGARLLCIVLALQVFPSYAQDAVTYYEDAISRFADGDYKAAEIQLKNALQADSKHLPSRLLLGRVQMFQGNPAAAEKELKIALRLGAARDKVYATLGSALLLQRKYQEILDTITTVNSSTPEAEEVYIFRGRAHLGLYQLDEADASFEQAERIAPNGVETLLGKAAVLKARGELDQAEVLVDRALQLYPDSQDGWYEKGRIRATQDDVDGALASFNHILAEAPQSYRALVARGTLYLKLGRNEEALEDLQIVHENVRSDFSAAFLYASALSRLGRNDEANVVLSDLSVIVSRIPEEVLRKEQSLLRTAVLLNYLNADLEQASVYGARYLSMRPQDYEMGKLVGAIYLQLGDVDTAINTLYPIYRLRPDDPELMLLLGEAHLEKKQYAEASRLLEQAAILVPDSAAVGTRLGLGKFGMGLPGEGESELLRSFELNAADSIGAGFILAQLQLRKQDTESALAITRKLVSRQPDNPVLYNLLGAVYVQAGELDSARKAYEKAARVSPGFLGGEYNLALLDIHEARYEDARARLNKLIELQPQSVLVLIALADLESALGDEDKAIPWLIKAAALDAGDSGPAIKLVDLYIRGDQLGAAQRQGENVARLYPNDFRAIAALARVQAASGQKVEAVASLRKAVVLADTSSGGELLTLADQQVKLADYTGARKTLVVVDNTDRAPEAQAALIRLNLATGDIEAAEAGLARLEKLTTNAAVTSLFLGDIRFQQKQYRAALKAYRESFDLTPGTLSAIGVFKSQFLLGYQDAAQNWLNSWCLAHPEDIMARRSLARSLLSTGKREGAREGFEQLIVDGYGTAEDYSFLARIYQLNKDERAEELARLAFELDPESSQVLDVYGWILVTEGRASEGLPYLREAVSRDSDPFLRYHLASALNEMGRTSEARLELEAIIRSGQDLPWVASAQELYDSLPAQE
jgi:putative PEP-CTERM system TPR-repeat lipoprotein